MQKLEKITPERAELLRGWVHSGFAVNSQRRVAAEDRKGLQSLPQYMERAPVSLDRLTYRLDGLVLYRGNFNPGLGTDHRLVSGVEFLALLVPHVLLRFECVIRSYGAASTTRRRPRCQGSCRLQGDSAPRRANHQPVQPVQPLESHSGFDETS